MSSPTPRACVRCGKPLPGNSKMSRVAVPATVAAANQWPSEDNADGNVTIDMCLQCQIARSPQQAPR